MKVWRDVIQGTDEWFDLRLGKVTGSQYAKMMSGVTTKGFKDLINGVAYEYLYGQSVEGDYENEWMIRGTELEPEARAYYEAELLEPVQEVGFIEFDKWMGHSPDGVINETEGLIEIKCPKWNTMMDYLERDKGALPPSPYKWQVLGPMALGPFEFVDFVAYHPVLPSMIRRYEKKDYVDLLEDFMDRVNDVKLKIEAKVTALQIMQGSLKIY